MTMFDSGPCDWLVLPLLLPNPTALFSLDHKRRSRKRNRKTWKRSDSFDSDLRFSQGHRLSSDYDSDSVASESQLFGHFSNLTTKLTGVKVAIFHNFAGYGKTILRNQLVQGIIITQDLSDIQISV